MLDTFPPASLTADDLKANLDDIQGGVLEDYDTPARAHIFYTIQDARLGRAWLRKIASRVTTSRAARAKSRPEQTLNAAFSAFGLEALGVADATRSSFPQAFRQGMAARAGRLGDAGPGQPSYWEEGLGSSDIHVMITITGPDPLAVDARRRRMNDEAAPYGVIERHSVSAAAAFDQRSGCPSAHFGFVDPISQPAIAGLGDAAPGDGARDGDGWRGVQPGEFLLGYVNELGETTATPTPREIGVNGTFIAFRKVAQDVAGFRDYLKSGAMSLWGQDDAAHQEKMAAKIIGRWRSGCPLALSPARDDLDIANDPNRVNDFDYADDPGGAKCPLGAHLRRVNPRRSAIKTATDINRKRLLRRGLEYGPPLPVGATDDGVPRGFAGLFVVADLELQFEFVQAEWIQKGDFAGLPSDERDRLIGANGDSGQYTAPGADMPFLADIRQFVTTDGGEYFFAPSISALRGVAAGDFSD